MTGAFFGDGYSVLYSGPGMKTGQMTSPSHRPRRVGSCWALAVPEALAFTCCVTYFKRSSKLMRPSFATSAGPRKAWSRWYVRNPCPSRISSQAGWSAVDAVRIRRPVPAILLRSASVESGTPPGPPRGTKGAFSTFAPAPPEKQQSRTTSKCLAGMH